MSYNISQILEISNTLTISADDVQTLRNYSDWNPPEDCFLDGLRLTEAILRVEKLSWYGEGSGRSWERFKSSAVPKLKGEFKGLVVWEGGDSVEPIWIRDGVLVPCTLDLKLKELK